MAEKKRDVDQLLPLTPRVLLILWGLAEGPQHGYRLLKTTEELGRGRVSIGPASLYEAIHSLKVKGLISETNAPEGQQPDSRRRYFALTELGRRVLEAEAERLLVLADDLRRTEIVSAGRQP